MKITSINKQLRALLETKSWIGINRNPSTNIFSRPICVNGRWLIMEPQGSPGKAIWNLIAQEMEKITRTSGKSWQFDAERKRREFPLKEVENVLRNVNLLHIDGQWFPDPEQYLEARLSEDQIVLHVDILEAGIDFIGFPVPESLRNTDDEPEFLYFNIDYVLMFAQMGLDLYYLPDPWIPGVLIEKFNGIQSIVGLVMPVTWNTSKNLGKQVVANNGTLVFPYNPRP